MQIYDLIIHKKQKTVDEVYVNNRDMVVEKIDLCVIIIYSKMENKY